MVSLSVIITRARCWQTWHRPNRATRVSSPVGPWQQCKGWRGTVFSENIILYLRIFVCHFIMQYCPLKDVKLEGEYYKNRQEQWFMLSNVNTSPFEETNDVGLATRGGRCCAQRDKDELTRLYCAWGGQHSWLCVLKWPVCTLHGRGPYANTTELKGTRISNTSLQELAYLPHQCLFSLRTLWRMNMHEMVSERWIDCLWVPGIGETNENVTIFATLNAKRKAVFTFSLRALIFRFLSA